MSTILASTGLAVLFMLGGCVDVEPDDDTASEDELAILARGTTGSVHTTDSGAAGGTGLFWHKTLSGRNECVIGARDNQKDGKGVWVRVTWGHRNVAIVMDTDGARNGVKKKFLNIPDGTRV